MTTTNLSISAQLQQTANPNQWKLNDTTPTYSAGNTGGWGYPNDSINSVISGYLNNCIFYNAPANALVQNLGNVELMPSPNALPYVYLQSYVLTPSMFGLPSFNNGILTCVYTINTSVSTVSFHNASGGSGLYVVGDTITDSTQSKVVGVVLSVTQAIGAGTLVLSAVAGTTIVNNDNLTNGTVTSQVTGGNPVYSTNAYTYNLQFTNLTLVEYNMGKKLACIDLKDCGCNCDEVEALFYNVMIPVIVANAQNGAGQNKAALNSIGIAQQNSCNILV